MAEEMQSEQELFLDSKKGMAMEINTRDESSPEKQEMKSKSQQKLPATGEVQRCGVISSECNVMWNICL